MVYCQLDHNSVKSCDKQGYHWDCRVNSPKMSPNEIYSSTKV